MKLLSNTIGSLVGNVSIHASVYAAARPSHPALASYETIADVLTALGKSSPLSADERDPILIAIVTEHQRTRHALWQAILLKTFAPLLLSLRKRLGKSEEPDRDQAVLLAFLDAARSIRTESHIARCLRIVTEAKVFETERKARRHAGAKELDEEAEYPDVFAPSAHTQVAAKEVLDLIEAAGGPGLRDMMFATCALDETVAEYVARAHAWEPLVARARIADNFRRQRSNVLQKLNARVERKEQARGLARIA